MFTSVVFHAPERPNSATIPVVSQENFASTLKVPKRFSMATSSIALALDAGAQAARGVFRSGECRQRQQHRERGQA